MFSQRLRTILVAAAISMFIKHYLYVNLVIEYTSRSLALLPAYAAHCVTTCFALMLPL
jgi:Co/Zn/Cd efflux system component